MESLPVCYLFLLSERYDRCKDPKKRNMDENLSEKKERKRQAVHLFAHVFQIRDEKFRSKFAKLSGASY